MNPNDPTLRAWIDIRPDDDFSIQNLPFGVMETPEWGPRVAVAIGPYALDLYECAQRGFFDELSQELPTLGAALPQVFRRRALNQFLRLGRAVTRAVRARVSELLRHDNPELRDDETAVRACLRRQSEVRMRRPVRPRNYVDFYSSLAHATRVGQLFRPDQPLLPNYQHLPVAYHGRANSIVVSGTPIRRPHGQYRPAGAEAPVFGPTQELDFELETALVVGQRTRLGQPVPIAETENYLFGLVLFNDWSARDVQRWEYQPLGPFLGKSFASSVSPWVVTLDALAPCRVPGPVQEPAPLPYLQAAGPGHFDVHLEAWLHPAGAPSEPLLLSQTNMRHLYWSPAQQLAHQASNGCPLSVGDLYASGTISDAGGGMGCLLELTQGGRQPLSLPDGSALTYLRAGDTVILKGFALTPAGVRLGLGEVRGTVVG